MNIEAKMSNVYNPKLSQFKDYDPSKKLSQQIAMTKSDLIQLEQMSPFDITHVFDCISIRTERGVFSLTLYVTPQMKKGDKAWMEHKIGFKAEQILDNSFDKELLKTYPIDKVDEVFQQHFVSRAK